MVAVIAIGLIAALPGVGEIRDRLSAADPAWIAACAACALLSMFGFVRALWSVFDRVMPWRRALVLGFAEQGANVLIPAGGAGGPALGALVMTRIGVPSELADQPPRGPVPDHERGHVRRARPRRHARHASASSPATCRCGRRCCRPSVAAIAIVLAVIFARSDAPPRAGQRTLPDRVLAARRFVRDGVRTSVVLLRHGDPLLIFGAVTYFAFDVASLACAFQAFGGGAPPSALFILAYALGHAGAFLPTPGGVGGTEGGLIGMFVAYGTPIGRRGLSVLAYRVFQLGLPAVLGAISLLRIRHTLAPPPPREEVEARWAGHA